MIWFNGFPFLDNKEEHVFNVPVSHGIPELCSADVSDQGLGSAVLHDREALEFVVGKETPKMQPRQPLRAGHPSRKPPGHQIHSMRSRVP
jgi:hypothetical protein